MKGCLTGYNRIKTRAKDHTGETHNHLTILGYVPLKEGERHLRVNCLCYCGAFCEAAVSAVIRGVAKACYSCSHPHYHGGRGSGTTCTPEYYSYTSMKSRCNNPHSSNYKHYGAKGVKVCPQWNHRRGFKRFLEDMGERPAGTTLDRLSPFGDYTPDNCRWSTPKEQNNNQRRHYKGD